MKLHRLFILLFVSALGVASVACGSDKDDDTPPTTGPGGDGGGDDRGKDTDMPGIDIGPLKLADPFILFYNKRYYAYGTSDTQPNAGFELYYSTDMKKWKKHDKLILSRDDSYGTEGFWAPEIYYRESDKLFYLYYTASEHLCVATAANPAGPFVQAEKTAMLAEKAIDSSLFVDDDGTAYLYYVKFNEGNCIWGAELDSDWKTIRTSTQKQCIAAGPAGSWERKQGQIVEGPSVFKEDGVYYMIYSANHYQSQDYAVGYATAPSPLGPWTKAEENPILHRPAGLVGTGHGARFEDRNYNWKYVFHAHNSTTSVNPRVLCITDVTLKEGRLSMSTAAIVQARQVD